jgi:hypothetical protein
MKFQKLIVVIVGLALTLAICSTPASADQLTLGGDGTATFTGLSTGFQVTATGSCPAGSPPTNCIGSATTGSFESPIGTTVFANALWEFSIPSISPFLTVGALNGSGVYPVINGNPSSFQFSGTAASAPGGGTGDTVTGTINWTAIDPANIPGHNLAILVGMLTVTNSTGKLVADYPIGGLTAIDYTFDLGPTNSLASIAGVPEASITGQASSGEVPNVPEVDSILLLGTGLLSAGTFARLRRRKA